MRRAAATALAAALLLAAAPAHADGWRYAGGFGFWGFAEGKHDADGFGFDFAVQRRIGEHLLVGGRAVFMTQLELDLFGSKDTPPDGADDLGPSVGVVVGDALRLHAAVTPAFVWGRKQDRYATVGLGLDAGVDARIAQSESRAILLGFSALGDVNAAHSFGAVVFQVTVDR